MTGALMIIMTIIMQFFLHENPKKAGIAVQEEEYTSTNNAIGFLISSNISKHLVIELSTLQRFETTPPVQVVVQQQFDVQEAKGIGFWEAWSTPGLIKYSIVFACIKGSTYGLLFWLPDYLQSIMNFGEVSDLFPKILTYYRKLLLLRPCMKLDNLLELYR